MKKLPRLLVIALLVFVGLFVVGLLCVNLYVQSEGAQAKLKAALEEAVGAPVLIQQTSVAPWCGLKLSGITIANPEVGKEPFLTAKSFNAHLALGQLFRHRFVFEQVRLQNPKVIWRQSADGRWHVPGTGPEAKEESPAAAVEKRPSPEKAPPRAITAATAAVQPAPAPRSISAVPVPEDTADETPAPEKKEGAVEVRRIKIVDGDFAFLDKEGRRVCLIRDVDMSAKVLPESSLSGFVEIEEITVRDKFRMADVESAFDYNNSRLILPNFRSEVAKGILQIDAQVHPNTPGTPFSLDSSFAKVDLDTMISEANGPRKLFHGKLEGEFHLQGNVGDLNSHAGKGLLKLLDGGLEEIPFLKTLGDALKIEELKKLQFDSSELTYRIGEGRFNVEPLLIQSQNLRLVANGAVHYDGAVKLKAKLYVNRSITRRLPEEIEKRFTPASDVENYDWVAFDIYGTVDQLDTDLEKRLLPDSYRKWYKEIKGLKDLFWNPSDQG